MEINALEQPDDLSGVIETHGLAWQVAYEDLLPDAVLSEVTTDPTEEQVQAWFDRVNTDTDTFLIAVDETDVSRGYIYLLWGEETKDFVGDNEAGLKEIYVHPDWWGDGIGTRLLEHGIESLPPHIEAIRLEMLAGNDVGDGFYRARGFEQTGQSEFEIGDRTYPTTIYTRDL